MKKQLILTVLLMGFMFGLTGVSQAKWWIFGKNTKGVRIHYLYLNKISFDNSVDPSITMFKGNLINGNLIIKGKASTSKGSIGSVQVTLDDKETWNKAKLSQNGSFEFVFTPQIDKVYKIFIKIMDTTGKTNDVAATYKELKIIDTDISGLVRKTLQKLSDAYQEQDPARFMRYVSPDFESDEVLLDTAIRKDFNTFDYIQIKYFINTIAAGNQGRIFVSINYNRSVVSAKSGEMLSDHGLTEFVFAMVNDIPKLVRIKNPLLFGLSDASSVATGTINSGTNNPILLVDEYGNALQKPFRDAIEIINNGNSFSSSSSSSSTVTTGTITVANGINLIEGYPFEYTGLAPNELAAPAASYVKSLGTTDIDTVTSVTVLATDNDFIVIDPNASQNSYAIKFSDGKYMLIQHTNGDQLGSTLKYRFQSNGTSSF